MLIIERGVLQGFFSSHFIHDSVELALLIYRLQVRKIKLLGANILVAIRSNNSVIESWDAKIIKNRYTSLKVYHCGRCCVFVFCPFRAVPAPYGGWIRAVAAGLHHSHSNARSEPSLRPTLKLRATPDPNPLSETRNLMVPSQIRFCCAVMGTPIVGVLTVSS